MPIISSALSQVQVDRVVLVCAIFEGQVDRMVCAYRCIWGFVDGFFIDDGFIVVVFFVFIFVLGLIVIFYFERQVGSSECVCVVRVSDVVAEVGGTLASDALLVAAAQDDLLLP